MKGKSGKDGEKGKKKGEKNLMREKKRLIKWPKTTTNKTKAKD